MNYKGNLPERFIGLALKAKISKNNARVRIFQFPKIKLNFLKQTLMFV